MRLESSIKVEELAKRTARYQGMLARSPASIGPDGSVMMCAAACIAYAALRVKDGLKAAEDFRRKLKRPSESVSLEKTFEHLNLSTTLCRMIRIENDLYDSSRRLDWFLDSRHLTSSPKS